MSEISEHGPGRRPFKATVLWGGEAEQKKN
jgi:hypothetical protein